MASQYAPAKSRFYIESFLKNETENFNKKTKNKKLKCINIGCGTRGRYGQWLKGWAVDGIDVLPAKTKMPWKHHVGDAAKLPFKADTFDVAVAIESFEHIEKNQKAMKEARRVLKKNGQLILTVPTNYTWVFEFGRHAPYYYTKPQIKSLIEKNGFKIKKFATGGGPIYFISNIIRGWTSPIGSRIFGKRWWQILNGILWPVFVLSIVIDRFIPMLPSNWLIIAKKA